MKEFFKGFFSAYSIFIAYLPYGLAAGLLGREIGLSLTELVVLGGLLYAGGAQLIAFGLIKEQSSLWQIILTTFVVNLRYFMLSLSLSLKLASWSRLEKVLLAKFTSDESFAFLHTQFSDRSELPKLQSYGVTSMGVFSWVFCTGLGHQIGHLFGDLNRFGLDFAVTSVFISMLALLIRTKHSVLVALLAISFVIAFKLIGLAKYSILMAAVLVPLLMAVLQVSQIRKDEKRE